jgi:hypothetical protein
LTGKYFSKEFDGIKLSSAKNPKKLLLMSATKPKDYLWGDKGTNSIREELNTINSNLSEKAISSKSTSFFNLNKQGVLPAA